MVDTIIPTMAAIMVNTTTGIKIGQIRFVSLEAVLDYGILSRFLPIGLISNLVDTKINSNNKYNFIPTYYFFQQVPCEDVLNNEPPLDCRIFQMHK